MSGSSSIRCQTIPATVKTAPLMINLYQITNFPVSASRVKYENSVKPPPMISSAIPNTSKAVELIGRPLRSYRSNSPAITLMLAMHATASDNNRPFACSGNVA